MLQWLWRQTADPPPERRAVPPRRLPEVGDTLSDRYLLDHRIGAGGAAAVFRARDLVLDQPVAVKVLLPDGIAAQASARSPDNDLRSEAVAAMRLSHPLIARVFTYDRHTPWEYLVMELVPGRNLHEHRRGHPEGRLPLDTALRIGVDVCAALSHAHGQGVVHNDVKPRNVLIDTHGAIKVCDFGLARFISSRTRGDDRTIAGTAAYMSPERLKGEPGSPTSDVYALGATLFTLVHGATPFGTRAEEAFRGHLRRPVPTSPFVPDALDGIVRKAMAKDPAHRYPDADALADALLGVLHGRALVQTLRPPEPEPAAETSDLLLADPTDEITETAPPITLDPIPLEAIPAVAEPVVAEPAVAEPAPIPADMARVPGGRIPIEDARHDVAPFLLDRTPVTNADYARFVAETDAVPPAWWPGRAPPRDRADHPVVGVTLDDARAFAAWAGKRLPTTLEWIAAARGEEGRAFPWGETCEAGGCTCYRVATGTGPVDAHPESATPEGVLDLLGNVWEWTERDDRFAPDEPGYHYVLGSSYRHRCTAAHGTLPRTVVGEHGEYLYLGFRCARDAEEAR